MERPFPGRHLGHGFSQWTILQSFSFLLLLLSLLFLGACEPNLEELPDETLGLQPVYEFSDWADIQLEAPRPIERLGKIYYKTPYIFAAETGKGVHVIDNTDPENPRKIHFLKVIGNSDVAVKGNVLYANNITDLVAIDIGQIANDSIRILNRIPETFQLSPSGLPSGYEGYFECPDPDKGIVVGWVEATLEKPECWQ